MNQKLITPPADHSLTADKFLYFFMGLRKGEIRRRVTTLRAKYPDEGPEQLARRLILAQTTLSMMGGALLHVPLFLPGVSPGLKVLGMTGGASVLMRLQMTLVLEIALLYGHDIDENARLREIAIVIAAAGLVSCTPFLTQYLNLKSYYALLSGAMTISSASKLVGDAAVLYYHKKAREKEKLPPSEDAAAALK